jgi:hypothetical protein
MNWNCKNVLALFTVSCFHWLIVFLLVLGFTPLIYLAILKAAVFLNVHSINNFILDNSLLILSCSFFLAILCTLLLMRLLYITSSRYRRFLDAGYSEPLPFLSWKKKETGFGIKGLETLSGYEITVLKKAFFTFNFNWRSYIGFGISFVMVVTLYFTKSPSFLIAFLSGIFFACLIFLPTINVLTSTIKKLIGEEGVKLIIYGNTEE